MSSLALEVQPRGARDACVFIEEYIAALYNTSPDVSGEEYTRRLRDEILPKYTHPGYVHAVNAYSMDQATLLEATKYWRSLRFALRTRMTKFVIDTVVDNEGSADMRHCRVGFNFDLVVEKAHKPKDGKGKPRIEESRTTGIGIATIVHSKIERLEVVCDTSVFHQTAQQLDCVIS